MFTNGFDWSNGFSLLHLLTLPVLLYGLCKLDGPVRFGWAGSLAHGFTIYSLSFLTDAQLNVNCVWRSCFEFSVPQYHLVWPALITGVVMVSFGLVYLYDRYVFGKK